MSITIALIGIGGAIGLVVYALLSTSAEKAVVRSSLRQLDGYEVDNLRDQELLNPFANRVALPIVKRLTILGRRFTPTGYVDKVKTKFNLLGRIGPEPVDKFLALRVLTVVTIPVGTILIRFLAPLDGMARTAAIGMLGMVCALGPDAVLNRRVAERQLEIRRKLPDILDLMVISVEAGLGFEQALDRTVASVPGPLSEEFTRMLGEVRAGSTRADAMRSMEKRTNVPEMRSFVLAILQADTFGVSIGRVLRAQADEMRIKRRQLAQERAMKAPVKMLIPMVFCIFPALFVIVLGPAMIKIMNEFT